MKIYLIKINMNSIAQWKTLITYWISITTQLLMTIPLISLPNPKTRSQKASLRSKYLTGWIQTQIKFTCNLKTKSWIKYAKIKTNIIKVVTIKYNQI